MFGDGDGDETCLLNERSSALMAVVSMSSFEDGAFKRCMADGWDVRVEYDRRSECARGWLEPFQCSKGKQFLVKS